MLRALFPFMSLRRYLRFSRTTREPYTWDYPYVHPVDGGKYQAGAGDDRPILEAGSLSAALDALTAALPATPDAVTDTIPPRSATTTLSEQSTRRPRDRQPDGATKLPSSVELDVAVTLSVVGIAWEIQKWRRETDNSFEPQGDPIPLSAGTSVSEVAELVLDCLRS